MTDNTNAQYESASPQNKPPLPGQTYGQSTMYATLPKSETSQNVSGSGKANAPPEPVLLPESNIKETTYTPSETEQYYSVHPDQRPTPNLVDMNAVKGSEAVYNYTKNLKSPPSQIADVLTLSKDVTKEPSGLVDIYANTETKNGVTTTTTIVPGEEKVYQLQGTEAEQLAQLKTLNADTRTKLILAQGITGHGFESGEITTIGNLPFSRTIDKSLNIKNNFGVSSNKLVPQVSASDALFTLVPSFGGGLITKGTELAIKGVSALGVKYGKSALVTPAQKVAMLLSKAMQEKELVMSKPEIVEPYNFELHQGTIGTSGVKQVKYSELTGLNPTVERLSGGAVKATKPEPPSYFTPTIEKTGIGPKGEPQQIPFENIKEINPNIEGQAKIQAAFGNLKEGSVTLVRGEGLSKLEPTTYLMEVQGGDKLSKLEQAGLMVHFGVEKGVFKGNILEAKATELTKSLVSKNLNPGEKKMPLVVQGTHAFKFSVAGIRKTPNELVAITKEPEIIKGTNLPELERPNVIETLIVKHPSSVRFVSPVTKGTRGIRTTRPTKETFDMERYPLMSSHEAAFHAENVLKEFSGTKGDVLQSFQKAERADPFGKTESSLTKNAGRVKYESELLTITYPPESRFKNVSGLVTSEKIEQSAKARQSTESILLEKNVQDLLSKPSSRTESKTDLLTKTSEKTDTLLIPLSGTRTDQLTGLTTKQTTTQITQQTTGNPPPTKTTTNPPPPTPFEEQKRRYKKLKSRTAKEVNFLGNAPVSDVIGLTRRADLTYGNKLTAGLVRKDISKTKSGKLSTFKLYNKISKNKTTNLSPHSFKPKNTKKESIYKKLRL